LSHRVVRSTTTLPPLPREISTIKSSNRSSSSRNEPSHPSAVNNSTEDEEVSRIFSRAKAYPNDSGTPTTEILGKYCIATRSMIIIYRYRSSIA